MAIVLSRHSYLSKNIKGPPSTISLTPTAFPSFSSHPRSFSPLTLHSFDVLVEQGLPRCPQWLDILLTLYQSNSARQQGNGFSRLAPNAPQISSSHPYGGAPEPGPAPISNSSAFLDSGSPHSPRGGFIQPPRNYAQHSGISHPGGVPFPGGFQLPGNTTSSSVIARTGRVTSPNGFSQAPQAPPPDLGQDEYARLYTTSFFR